MGLAGVAAQLSAGADQLRASAARLAGAVPRRGRVRAGPDRDRGRAGVRFLRPRSTGGLALRFFVLAILVIGSVAATAAVAGLLQVQNLVNDISFNKAIKSSQVKVPAAGAPQTILLIGSDHRVSVPLQVA